MTYTKILSRLLFCTFAALTLSQCGGGGTNKAEHAELTIFPAVPTVITAPVKVGDKDVKDPWFSFEVEIDNQTDQAFKIVALQAEITGTDSSGFSTTKKMAWAPGESDYTTDSLQCEYTSFGTWTVNEKKRLRVEGTGLCNSGNVSFYSDNNTSGVKGTNFRYKVKLIPVGYFIDDQGDPEDRFEKFKLFFTK